MATLIDLEREDKLYRIDPELGPHQMECRRIYVFPDVMSWMADRLPDEGSTWQIEVSPIEQLAALVADFCLGEILTYGLNFKPLNHIEDGIWELKTADLRLFGWFHQQDTFIVTDGNLADTIKRSHMYRPYCEQAVRRRDALDLDEPKFLSGSDPNVVVSNFGFA